MATKRFGYLDDLSLKNQKVGIGTSTANEKLEVLGGTRGGDVVVTGIASLTSYEGFQNTKFTTTGDVLIGGGESGTLSGEIVIGSGTTLSVGTGATSGQGTIECMKVYDTFTPPCGGTVDRPSGAKPGTIYYNRDFKTIEYWDGKFWRQVDNTTRSGRGVAAGGEGFNANIEFVNIQSKGNATEFGVLTAARANAGAVSSGIRGIYAGGEPATDLIQYITIASQGDAIDFDGNLTANRRFVTGCSSSTRGVFMGGSEPTRVNKIEYIEMGTAGVNAADFGDLTEAKDCGGGGSWSNGVRGGVMGGSPSNFDYIEVITIASLGNAVKFGKAVEARHNQACASNSVRAIAGGGSPETSRIIQFFTMASDGNATFFGDLTAGRTSMNACADGTRVVFFGGNSSPAKVNNIEFVTIATTGSAEDFGDLSFTGQNMMALSDSHGGLGGF